MTVLIVANSIAPCFRACVNFPIILQGGFEAFKIGVCDWFAGRQVRESKDKTKMILF